MDSNGEQNSFTNVLNISSSSSDHSFFLDIEISFDSEDNNSNNSRTPGIFEPCEDISNSNENPINNDVFTFTNIKAIIKKCLEFYFKNIGIFPISEDLKTGYKIYMENEGYLILKSDDLENRENKNYNGNLIIYMITSKKKDPLIEKQNEEYFEKNYKYKFEGKFSADVPSFIDLIDSLDGKTLFTIELTGETKIPNLKDIGRYYSFGKTEYICKFKKDDKMLIQMDLKSDDIEICYEDNSYYRGEARNFLRKGKGLLIFADGQRYVGEFKYNKMNGKGTFFSETGEKVWEGEFKNDNFVIP